jgi:hypothetical protein
VIATASAADDGRIECPLCNAPAHPAGVIRDGATLLTCVACEMAFTVFSLDAPDHPRRLIPSLGRRRRDV